MVQSAVKCAIWTTSLPSSLLSSFQQYQKLNGLSEKDAKVRYIQVCRSLPTYGITFFLIKVIYFSGDFYMEQGRWCGCTAACHLREGLTFTN